MSMPQFVTSYLLELPNVGKSIRISQLISTYINHQYNRSLATAHDLFDPWESQFVHFHSQLEQVVQTLALSLCLGGVVAPDIAAGSSALAYGHFINATGCHNLHSVSADKYSICVGVLVHGCLQPTGEILLKGSVLNDGDLQSIEESEHTLALTTRNTLDLLNVVDLEASIGALLPLHQ